MIQGPTMLTAELLSRIRARVADPRGRTDAPDMSPETSFLGGAFKTVRMTLGGGPPPPPSPLPVPASDKDIAAAEAKLGFPLPADLKQLYAGIADGGFGPNGGLVPLKKLTKHYRQLSDAPPDEVWGEWPEHLLPIIFSDPEEPGEDCYDLKSGQIILWDQEELFELWDYEADPGGPSEEILRSCFRKQAESLGAWFEDWLSRPPMADQLHQQMENALRDNLKQSLDYWRAMSPQERAEFGLPEEGWEEQLFGHLGIDLKNL